MHEPIVHGGRLHAAAHEYRIATRHWLDLSTGINPHGWPVPPIPAEVWQRLPEDDDGLTMAMLARFGTRDVMPVAGTQAAILALPKLRERGVVGVLSPTYAEHAQAWRVAGHVVHALSRDDIERVIDILDVLVVVNPNNPTGELIERAVLQSWHARLAVRGGWLVVDEAFIEATTVASVLTLNCLTAQTALTPTPLPQGEGLTNPLLAGEGGAERRVRAALRDQSRHKGTLSAGLIVLRSLGKFWGLAGVRAGFVLAEAAVLAPLREALGPWHVSHPARWIAQRALMDLVWCDETRERLLNDSIRLAELLAAHALLSPTGCALFRWVPTERAAWLYDALAKQAVLVRCFDDGVRFGLPGDEAGWEKLNAALGEVMR